MALAVVLCAGIIEAQSTIKSDPSRRERIMAKMARLQAEQREAEKAVAAQAQLVADIQNELSGPTETTFTGVSSGISRQLTESMEELDRLRKMMADEQVPLSRRLSELETELSKVRLEYQQVTRTLDSRTLDLSNLRNEIKSREEEATYLSNLLGEYIRNFESRLHIAEVQRYREIIEKAKLAMENTNLSQQKVYEAQTAMVQVSIERLQDALGASRFEGSAVTASGLLKPGTFVLIGPAAVFRSSDGENVGPAEQRLGSLEPAVISYANGQDTDEAAKLVSEARGSFPFDPSLGNAHKVEETKESLWEHIKKGGPVMVPIFILAGAAFLVAMYKWSVLAFLRTPSPREINELCQAIAKHDIVTATQRTKSISGPVGKMLAAGVEHIKEPRELIEEVMFEIVLATRLKLQGLLPFIAISASSAPLLGLLGTVTGIMNTFKLITVFGSGDVKTLSGGISEALITTEFGLIVAIPSLLLHAFLSRKAKGITDQMEAAAIALINQLSKTPFDKDQRSEAVKISVGDKLAAEL
jgi:biopolymer transport protein ExbB